METHLKLSAKVLSKRDLQLKTANMPLLSLKCHRNKMKGCYVTTSIILSHLKQHHLKRHHKSQKID